MTTFQVPEQMRQMAETSVEQARKAFDQFIEASHQAMASVEGTARSAQEGVGDAGRQALSYIEENVTATFTLAKRLAQARTLEEMTALQQEFLRKQFENVAMQGKAVGDQIMKAAEKVKKSSK